ncbi:hypothetical protein Tco_0309695 [Tanacetum coccineum]
MARRGIKECGGEIGAGGGEVNGGGEDFGVSKSLLCEIPGVVTGESGEETFGDDGGAICGMFKVTCRREPLRIRRERRQRQKLQQTQYCSMCTYLNDGCRNKNLYSREREWRYIPLRILGVGFHETESCLRRLKGSRLRGLLRISAMLSSEETFSIEMFPF